ncbi:MAG: ATPase, T2SS/T4P/T4SS family [Oscillochloridaceae bacterium umkhey_bin13]
MQPTPLDRQLGPAVIYLAALLRGGYSFRQAAEALAQDGPPELADPFRQLVEALRSGQTVDQAFASILQPLPSAYLDVVLHTINLQRQRGGNLAVLLEPVAGAIMQRAGSDGATAAQRARLAQLDSVTVNWPALDPSDPAPWAPGHPLEPWLSDPDVSEVLIDGPYQIEIVRKGHLERVAASFLHDDDLLAWMHELIAPLGHKLDAAHPILNARLADETLLRAVVPPVSPAGPALVLLKARQNKLSIESLLRYGAWTEEIVGLLQACVAGRINLLVAGGTSSGKTTIMDVLCGMIPPTERVISVEWERELRIERERLLTLAAVAPDAEGRAGLSVADLIGQAVLMRPDRLIVGELRGSEVLALVRAMNTGYNGSMSLLHATSPRDALQRLEQMAIMTEPAVPLRMLRQEIATAIQLIVQINQLADGVRRVVALSEVTGMEGENIALRDIVRFEADEPGTTGRISGSFRMTGYQPSFLAQLIRQGLQLPAAMLPPESPERTALAGQWAETVSLIAALLRSGYGLLQILHLLAQELPNPMGHVLGAVARQVDGGQPITHALRELEQTQRSPLVAAIVTALIEQRQSGGNLAEALEQLEPRLRQEGGADPALLPHSERIRTQYGL